MHPAGRALVGFWIVLLLLAGGGSAVLWWLGAPAATKPEPAALRPAAPSPPSAAAIGSGAVRPSGIAVAAPLPALEEPAPGLPGRTLPIVGPDGSTPALAYASHAGLPATGPQIAILLEGLGLSEAVDADALGLPAPISFAVSPYADGLERSATPKLLDTAREKGHELWLSLPMEPAGSPADAEGARALSLDIDLAKDRDALFWSLSRFGGYVGLTNALGGLRGDRFASSNAFGMVANEINRRGLLYMDAGLAPTEQPATMPARTRHADLAIDESPDASDIQTRLSRLEQLALENGSALGIAGPLRPVTIDRLRSWSRTLRERGITLVPVSALPAPHPHSVASGSDAAVPPGPAAVPGPARPEPPTPAAAQPAPGETPAPGGASGKPSAAPDNAPGSVVPARPPGPGASPLPAGGNTAPAAPPTDSVRGAPAVSPAAPDQRATPTHTPDQTATPLQPTTLPGSATATPNRTAEDATALRTTTPAVPATPAPVPNTIPADLPAARTRAQAQAHRAEPAPPGPAAPTTDDAETDPPARRIAHTHRRAHAEPAPADPDATDQPPPDPSERQP